MTDLFTAVAPPPAAQPRGPVSIRFFVHGIPKGQPRPRAFARRMGTKFVARVYNPSEAEGWKGSIAIAARDHRPPAPLSGPIRFNVDFIFPRPKSLMRKKDPPGRLPYTAKPDVDNVIKSTADALTELGFWVDDALITETTARKFYAAKDEAPGALLTIAHAETVERSA